MLGAADSDTIPEEKEAAGEEERGDARWKVGMGELKVWGEERAGVGVRRTAGFPEVVGGLAGLTITLPLDTREPLTLLSFSCC